MSFYWLFQCLCTQQPPCYCRAGTHAQLPLLVPCGVFPGITLWFSWSSLWATSLPFPLGLNVTRNLPWQPCASPLRALVQGGLLGPGEDKGLAGSPHEQNTLMWDSLLPLQFFACLLVIFAGEVTAGVFAFIGKKVVSSKQPLMWWWGSYGFECPLTWLFHRKTFQETFPCKTLWHSYLEPMTACVITSLEQDEVFASSVQEKVEVWFSREGTSRGAVWKEGIAWEKGTQIQALSLPISECLTKAQNRAYEHSDPVNATRPQTLLAFESPYLLTRLFTCLPGKLFALEVEDTRWKSWTGGKTDL